MAQLSIDRLLEIVRQAESAYRNLYEPVRVALHDPIPRRAARETDRIEAPALRVQHFDVARDDMRDVIMIRDPDGVVHELTALQLENMMATQLFAPYEIWRVPVTTTGSTMPTQSPSQRAEQLLVECLSPAQREEFREKRYFTVQAPDWGELQIHHRQIFNVFDPVERIWYCAGPEGDLPVCDVMLGQKLVLESNPETFFRQANRRREDEINPMLRAPPPFNQYPNVML